MEVTVVGAGVIGLTTALTLEERGHRVRIVAAARRADTTSAIAGAVWFPYRVGPPNKVTVWALRTRKWLEQLAGTPEAGIDVLTGYEILGDDGTTRPWWAAAPISIAITIGLSAFLSIALTSVAPPSEPRKPSPKV